MSAYMVDRHHIRYLIEAAKSEVICSHGDFRWRHNGQSHRITDEVALANMLWGENRKSIEYRYPDTIDHPEDSPGEIGETFVFIEDNFPDMRWLKFDPVQVMASCDCYSYQSCEHPGWEESEAKAFIDSLIGYVRRRVQGYDEAIWGVPVGLIER